MYPGLPGIHTIRVVEDCTVGLAAHGVPGTAFREHQALLPLQRGVLSDWAPTWDRCRSPGHPSHLVTVNSLQCAMAAGTILMAAKPTKLLSYKGHRQERAQLSQDLQHSKLLQRDKQVFSFKEWPKGQLCPEGRGHNLPSTPKTLNPRHISQVVGPTPYPTRFKQGVPTEKLTFRTARGRSWSVDTSSGPTSPQSKRKSTLGLMSRGSERRHRQKGSAETSHPAPRRSTSHPLPLPGMNF